MKYESKVTLIIKQIIKRNKKILNLIKISIKGTKKKSRFISS
jgi:hypothetical protein